MPRLSAGEGVCSAETVAAKRRIAQKLIIRRANFFPLIKYFRFFSNLVGEEGPRIPGVKDSSVCFLRIVSALLTFFRFLLCLFLVYPVYKRTIRNVKHPNVINGCLFSISFSNIRRNRHKRSYYQCTRSYLSSFWNFAVILYIFKQSSYDFYQTFNSL